MPPDTPGTQLQVLLVGLLALSAAMHAQSPKPVGSVATADATVTGSGSTPVQIADGRTPLAGNATVTAKPGHNAEVSLTRGGAVLVCQTTGLHVTPANDNSLLLALDRGAIEIRMKAGTGDVVMTPDLRFTPAASGDLDLRMRVTFNGDTCVENRGRKAPQLNISDAFGESSYLLKPGQHVMFEHGSLREVDDRETTPCGCPPLEKSPQGTSIADALLRGGESATETPQQAAAAHPFPAAVSDGLAQPTPVPAETPGERHVQVASTLSFNPNETVADSEPKAPAIASAPMSAAPAPPQTQHKHGPFAAVGRFFKRIFVR